MRFINSDPEKGGVGPWIVPDEEFDELAWRLRYANNLTRTEQVTAASILSGYAMLILWPRWRREQVVREIRRGLKQTLAGKAKEEA